MVRPERLRKQDSAKIALPYGADGGVVRAEVQGCSEVVCRHDDDLTFFIFPDEILTVTVSIL